MQRVDLQEIRDRTYKARDAWWTVILVDPVAVRLVRLVAPYRWITPNLLSSFAFVLGLGAAAAFVMQTHAWLAVGALLFHLSFVVDCMDGKIARLNGTGSLFGAWFDFIFDRIRVILCTVALVGGQYAASGSVAWIWLGLAIITLDLFRYLNSSQMAKIKAEMDRQLRAARGEDETATAVDVDAEGADSWAGTAGLPAAGDDRHLSRYLRARNWLLRRRIRMHLFSGIEYEMTVFIIGPLLGLVFWTSIAAGALLLLFELALVLRLYQLTRVYKRDLAAIQAGPVPRQREVTDEPSPIRV